MTANFERRSISLPIDMWKRLDTEAEAEDREISAQIRHMLKLAWGAAALPDEPIPLAVARTVGLSLHPPAPAKTKPAAARRPKVNAPPTPAPTEGGTIDPEGPMRRWQVALKEWQDYTRLYESIMPEQRASYEPPSPRPDPADFT